MDIFAQDDEDIVLAINSDSLDAEDLVGRDTWIFICQVRGRNFNQVDAEAWQALCAKRGYLLYRRNPRGF